jgi:hypothetical protein
MTVGVHVRARPDNAHIARQHIEKLRQLIDIRSAQKISDAGNACVVFSGLPAVGFGVYDHGPEFYARKTFAETAHPSLPEKYRSAGRQFNKNGQQRRQPAQHGQYNNYGNDYIEAPFTGEKQGFSFNIIPETDLFFQPAKFGQ